MTFYCAICHDENLPIVKVTEKGLKSLTDFSKKRNSTELTEFFENAKENKNDVYVHESCRKSFTDKRKLTPKTPKKVSSRSSKAINLNTDCLFCQKPCSTDFKNPSRNPL